MSLITRHEMQCGPETAPPEGCQMRDDWCRPQGKVACLGSVTCVNHPQYGVQPTTLPASFYEERFTEDGPITFDMGDYFRALRAARAAGSDPIAATE